MKFSLHVLFVSHFSNWDLRDWSQEFGVQIYIYFDDKIVWKSNIYHNPIDVFYYYTDDLERGLDVMEKLKEILLQRAYPSKEHQVKINDMEPEEFLRKTAISLNKAVHEVIPILKSSRKREPNQREAKARRTLEKALPHLEDNQRGGVLSASIELLS